MPGKSSETFPTLEQVAQAEAFGGFTPEDFAVFETPDFEARMVQIRAQIKPKLQCLGESLAPLLSAAYGLPLHPHVAQHLRRSVNPPEQTWVAFAHEARAYKPHTHLRVAILANEVRIYAFVEDDAADKARFSEALARNAADFSLYFAHHPTLHAYDIPDAEGHPARGHALDVPTLTSFAQRLANVKKLHARFGAPYNRSHPVLASGPEFIEAAMDAVRLLRPLYDCGRIPSYVYHYEPESVPVR